MATIKREYERTVTGYTISLSVDELHAVALLLGKTSHHSREMHGLTSRQNEAAGVLYRQLTTTIREDK